jgi:hypothetical protein
MKFTLRAPVGSLVLALVVASGDVASGQNVQADARIRSRNLTQALASLAVRHRAADAAERASLSRDMVAVAAERHALLLSLVESDPRQVMTIALPTELSAGLPDDVQAYAEQHVDLDGTLEVFNEDHRSGAVLKYILRAGTDRLSLHFTDTPPGLLTGDKVHVHGIRLDNTMALESGSMTAQSTPPAAGSATFGEQKTLILLVNFEDNTTQPYSTSQVHDIAFTTTSDFDRENSQQQTWLTGDVFGWFTIPMSSTVCDTNTLATLAKQSATTAGVNLSAYTRYVYAFPENVCTWWGLGSVGGNPSQAWINGDFQLMVLGHEMGHNLGLYHAHSMDCRTSPIVAPCTTSEYGDTIDMMGGAPGHFNAFMKERLGWIGYGSSPALTTVQSGGTYWLEPFESPSAGGSKALKILKSVDPATGARTWYYVEFRRASGFDSFLSSYPNVPTGVVMHIGTESSGNSNYLLDLTPETSSWTDPALVVGKSFSDTAAGITLQTASVSATGASVVVTMAASGCVPAAPGLSFSPSASQWAAPGATVRWTLSVRNNDSSGCGSASLDVSSAVQAGWVASVSSPLLTLAPGATGSSYVDVTSPSNAADGFYAVGFAATRNGTTTSTSGTYVVVSAPIAVPFTVSVTADAATYTSRGTVRLRATTNSGTSSPQGVSITFTLTKPNGTLTTLSGTTDASGVATATLKLSNKQPVGTWVVSAKGTYSGTTATGSTSFVVK